MAASKNIEKGKAGEDYTVGYLEQRGYKILERNWHDSHREIDIIALKDGVTVFVEVKSRHGLDVGLPEEGISKSKIKQLRIAAESYILANNIDQARFDIMAIIFYEKQPPDIHYIENAL
jgi:putative endonuclease